MPDFASCRLASTSWVLFPMDGDDAHPRDDNPPHDRLALSLLFCVLVVCVLVVVIAKNVLSAGTSVSRTRLQRGFLLEQANLQILRAIDNLAVHGKPPVGDAQNQL